jgi:hypothetical protein
VHRVQREVIVRVVGQFEFASALLPRRTLGTVPARLRRALRILGTTLAVTATLPLYLLVAEGLLDARLRFLRIAVSILGGVNHFRWFMLGLGFVSLMGVTLRWVCRPRSISN